jgi:hypothetical protein
MRYPKPSAISAIGSSAIDGDRPDRLDGHSIRRLSVSEIPKGDAERQADDAADR